MNDKSFENHNKKLISRMGKDSSLKKLTKSWFARSSKYEYSYHFKWLGLPIIQFPQDILAVQEIIWKTKPELIIETGIARGGSMIFLASMLELLGKGKVIGIDIDIRKHNKNEIEKHFLFKRIRKFQGSYTDSKIFNKIKKITKNKKTMVILDSNHTQQHVLKELEMYSKLVSKNCYLVVFDSIIEEMSNSFSSKRPWGKGNNPKTAIREFLKKNSHFIIDKEIQNKLLITVAPDGFLKCINN